MRLLTNFTTSVPFIRKLGHQFKRVSLNETRRCVGSKDVSLLQESDTIALWPSMKLFPPINSAYVANLNSTVRSETGISITKIIDFIKMCPQSNIRESSDLQRILCRYLAFAYYMACETNEQCIHWLKKDIHVASRQFSGKIDISSNFDESGLLNYLMSEVVASLGLHENIDGHIEEVALLLTYLSMDHTDKLLRQLNAVGRSRVGSSTWYAVSNTLRAASALNTRDYGLYRRVLKRLKDHRYKESTDPNAAVHYLSVIESTAPLASTNLCLLLCDDLRSILCDDSVIKTSQLLTTWTGAASSLYRAFPGALPQLQSCLIELPDYIKQLESNVSSYELCQIMQNTSKMKLRSAEMIQLDNHVGDGELEQWSSIELMLAFSYGVRSQSHKSVCVDVLKKRMSTILKSPLLDHASLFYYLFKAESRNLRTDGVDQLEITEFFDKYPGEATSLVYRRRSYADKWAAVEQTLEVLEDPAVIQSTHMNILLGTVLSNCDSLYPPGFGSVIEKAVSNLSLDSLMLLQKALRLNADNDTFPQGDFLDIGNCIWNAITTRVQHSYKVNTTSHISSDTLLNIVEQAHSIRYSYKHNDATVVALGELEARASAAQLALRDIEQLRNVCTSVGFYSPLLIQTLVDAALAETDQICQYNRASWAVYLCGYYGFVPNRCDELVQTVLDSFHQAMLLERWPVCVNILLRLASMDIFPEKELMVIFSDETLNRIVRQFLDNEDLTHARYALFRLTQSVMIHRPELATDGQINKFETKPKLGLHKKAFDDVSALVSRTMGASHSIQEGCQKQGVVIDIEICPKTKENSKQTSRSIAVICIGQEGAAVNQQNLLIGKDRRRLMLLEAMGYRVIVFVYNQWPKYQRGMTKKLMYSLKAPGAAPSIIHFKGQALPLYKSLAWSKEIMKRSNMESKIKQGPTNKQPAYKR